MTSDAQILAALRTAAPGAVSGAELADRLQISRAAIWARIQELRRLGYDIDASPHLGYRLVSAPDLLHADDLLSQLTHPRTVGRDIRVFKQTTSTNDIVEKLARDGVKEGVAVFAESQTKGRGRLGRPWVSPAGKGLWFSILLRPPIRPQDTTQLTVAAAASVSRAIRRITGLPAAIKWPNDIWIGTRKVAGILTEMNAELDMVRYAILGIGLSVNSTASDFPPEWRETTSSLRMEAGHSIPRATLAVALLEDLEQDYQSVRIGKFEAVAEEWQSRCLTLGRNVQIQMGSRLIKGTAESLDATGALLLRTQHGLLERITGGDVTMVVSPKKN